MFLEIGTESPIHTAYLVNAHMAVGKTHNLSNYCYVGSKLLRLQTFAKLVLGITTQIIAR